MIWPSAMGVRSTSMGTPAAIVEASGFICAISGTSVAAAPIAPTAPVATRRKSRRVGSAADKVVSVSVLSAAYSPHVRRTCPSAEPPLRGTRRGDECSRPPPCPPTAEEGSVGGGHAALHHRAGLLAPLPAERKPANAATARD